MREISTEQVVREVARLCIEASYYLGEDVLDALRNARQKEVSPVGQAVLDQILENVEIAAQGELPLCQDTGLTVVFLELGQEVHIVGGNLNEAVNGGRQALLGQGEHQG